MQRFYFHIRLPDGHVIEDGDGRELEDLAAAVHAAAGLKSDAAELAGRSVSLQPKSIEIADADYRLLAIVPAQS